MNTLASRKRKRPEFLDRGFTLVEVLLVLALLIIIAAMAAPSLSGSIERAKLDSAAKKLRTAWSEARLDAATQGETLRFQCRIGSGWGCVASATATTEQVAGAIGQQSAAVNGALELSDVVFKQLLVAGLPGDPPLGGGVADGELSAGVLFRPDGTTSDAEAVLEAANGARLKVTLRGLTGSARIVEVENE